MFKVGLTGGIGAGKSLISQMFAVLGVPIYNSDQKAKWLMTNSMEVKKQVIDAFGENAYLWDGHLNKDYLAAVVFNLPEKLNILNSIVHPALWKDSIQWAENQKGKPYTIHEAAILFETGGYKNMDFNIMVYAPADERIRRTMDRDKIDRQSVIARMDKQMPEDKKMELVDYIIYNDGSDSLISQIVELHHLLLEKSKLKNK
ncbi:MAG: dephospho-CoA kinase [Chitinophagales bacterium]|nr:dephospho-CoA kinase [Chitinophagales bacterium]MCZ2394040.1 dephospho-CoA kinase [Chitinophagales bacterium]